MKNSFLVYISLISCLVILTNSCQAYHPLHEHNYFNGSTFYNDSLNLRIQYAGDVEFKPLNELEKKKIKSKIKGIEDIRSKDLLVYGTAMAPRYNILFFLKNNKRQEEKQKVKLILKDSINNRVLYKKNDGQKTAYFLLESATPDLGLRTLLIDGLRFAESISYNTNFKEELTYSQIFKRYQDNYNYLMVREKLKNAPIPKTNQSEWMQFQYLATINSFMSNNVEHKKLINEFEDTRKEYLEPILDTLLTNPGVVENNSVITKISRLSRKTPVVMLNENHWYPKHRKFAIKLLKPLKDQGFTHLALEALYENEDSVINAGRPYPIFPSGYYTREPYFGYLVRKAKELGYTIVGYENYNDDINRELGQAQNLKDILGKDPQTKIFVYAGLAHIIEEETDRGKRMAAHFKEITNIDPLTINQVDVVSDIKDSLVMMPYDYMKFDEKFHDPVDFFVINNLELDYEDIYSQNQLKEIQIQTDIFSNYRDEKLLVSVYNEEEYSRHKSGSVPIINAIKEPKGENAIGLRLPRGSFVVKISTKKYDDIFLKRIEVE